MSSLSASCVVDLRLDWSRGCGAPTRTYLVQLSAKGALAVLIKLVWEKMKTRCATSRQRLLSRLTTVERAWRPLVSQVQTKDITVLTRWSGDSAELRLTAAW